MSRIQGRTAVVTGAGNGLGRAITIELSRRGARIVLTGRGREKLEAVAAECPGPTRVATVDAASEESVTALVDELVDEEVSILVNNAGVAGPVAALTEVPVKEWDEVFAVNVRGVFLMCRAFLPQMVTRGAGDVINLASVSGKRPLAGRTPYVASNMAVLGLTTTLAWEVGPAGVAVNSLSPGPVDGPRMRRNFRLEAERTGKGYEAHPIAPAAIRRCVGSRIFFYCPIPLGCRRGHGSSNCTGHHASIP
jgi:NAD(P)-dependent dehydrogenase (short-subunit alcohol dehydrogenase family)